MSPAIQALIASTLSSLLGLAGGFLLLAQYRGVQRLSSYLVSFAAGAMLGAAFFDLLAEAVSESAGRLGAVFTWLLVGFLLFFLIEKFLLWHHHGHGHERHDDVHEHQALGPLIIVGDAVHNFLDGTIIAAAFLVSPALGVSTATAVLAHELPQEIGDFGILIHGGMRRRAVAGWNLFGALVSPVGTMVTLLAAGLIDGLVLPLVALAAGAFIYIAAADLVPEIHREKSLAKTVVQLGLLVLGILTIIGVGQVFPGG
ncbi:MAG: ZIP family metal transporter [Candidatus Kerfeldbacteria bacterium]|nr:ZIP family metal transporter [Candidatus Kerfeldbacteria bacterium]